MGGGEDLGHGDRGASPHEGPFAGRPAPPEHHAQLLVRDHGHRLVLHLGGPQGGPVCARQGRVHFGQQLAATSPLLRRRELFWNAVRVLGGRRSGGHGPCARRGFRRPGKHAAGGGGRIGVVRVGWRRGGGEPAPVGVLLPRERSRVGCTRPGRGRIRDRAEDPEPGGCLEKGGDGRRQGEARSVQSALPARRRRVLRQHSHQHSNRGGGHRGRQLPNHRDDWEARQRPLVLRNRLWWRRPHLQEHDPRGVHERV
mmetsp:Transcript_118263/g.339306  ORF Transcript_118263/g.339306 Transcript_118263/m.339306 type:complete len:255 (+) Transcript_118263:905-1669(+)